MAQEAGLSALEVPAPDTVGAQWAEQGKAMKGL